MERIESRQKSPSSRQQPTVSILEAILLREDTAQTTTRAAENDRGGLEGVLRGRDALAGFECGKGKRPGASAALVERTDGLVHDVQGHNRTGAENILFRGLSLLDVRRDISRTLA